MLTDIRSRLMISYMVVIGVLIVVLTLLLVVMRPLQIGLTHARLGFALRRFQEWRAQASVQNGSLQQLVEAYQQWQRRPPERLLIIDTRQDDIIFDSDVAWRGQKLPLSPPSADSRGHLVGPDGKQHWLYLANPLSVQTAPTLWAVLVAREPRPLGAVMAELGWWFLISGCVALGIAIFLSFLIARSVATPLQAIAEAAELVAQNDFTPTVLETGPDEVKQLARSFNSMVARVQASQIAMQNFVSNASHELKTPLTSIVGFAQALLDGAAQNELARKQAANIIYQQATRMNALVKNLLDLARLDAGEATIQRRPIRLVTLLDGILDSLSPQISNKALNITKTYQTLPIIMGDGDRLHQVFTNLLDNAIKYTPVGGQITLNGVVEIGQKSISNGTKTTTLPPEKEYIRLSIVNTGPGIQPEDLNQIFDRFYQVDKSRQYGVGLGLAIVKEIVQAHKGHIEVESIPDQMTQFTLWLPVKEADITTLITRRR